MFPAFFCMPLIAKLSFILRKGKSAELLIGGHCVWRKLWHNGGCFVRHGNRTKQWLKSTR